MNLPLVEILSPLYTVAMVFIVLAAIIAMQGWIIRELFKVKAKVSIILTGCDQCKHNRELDTDRINKPI